MQQSYPSSPKYPARGIHNDSTQPLLEYDDDDDAMIVEPSLQGQEIPTTPAGSPTIPEGLVDVLLNADEEEIADTEDHHQYDARTAQPD